MAQSQDPGVDLTQIYTLVDSILPFEACLYYQVLPLGIEGSRLIMGMVDPDDHAAQDYVKRQLSFINYSISVRPVASDWHRDLLSKYLSHTSKSRQQAQARSQQASTQSKTSTPPPDATAPTTESQQSDPSQAGNAPQPTLVVDQPDQIEELGSSASPHSTSANSQQAAEAEAPQEAEVPAETPDAADGTENENASGRAPLHLQVNKRYKTADAVLLATLPPKELMQALLSKVLEEGIGRLYFERQAESGRILRSKDGVLQAVLESVNATTFQGVINEFKLMTHLSLIPVRKARQVEIERLYEQERILLRFRIMPGTHGEEATLQVLRGMALRFYQQQQIDKLGRDALDAAQSLQRHLDSIRDRARQSLDFSPTRSETLPTIIQLLKRMESQVQDMITSYEAEQNNSSGESPRSE